MIHTARRIPMPANMAFAGGNGCTMTLRKQPCEWQFKAKLTRPMAPPRTLLVDNVCKTWTVCLSNLFSFPLSPRNLRKACACSWRTALMASVESQFCSLMMRELSSKFVSACFSYSLRAVSKSDRRLDSEVGSEDIAKQVRVQLEGPGRGQMRWHHMLQGLGGNSDTM